MNISKRYYARYARVSEDEAAAHYQAIGCRLGLAPHPFFAYPGRPGSGDLGDTAATLSPILDIFYCAAANGVDVADVPTFVSSKIMRNEWFAFHPLVLGSDYLKSGFADLGLWVEFLCDPDRSLVGHDLTWFMPAYYRRTAHKLGSENELVDYLTEGDRSGGIPHVFFSPWYGAQFNDERPKLPRLQDLWQDLLSDVSTYGVQFSPFYQPLESNHEIFQKDGSKPLLHPLERFMVQAAPIVPPHAQVVPSAVAYAFLSRALEDCAPNKVTPQDVLKALELALAGATDSPGEVILSVCILNYNKPTHTILSSLAAARNAPPGTEVLILDNGSSPKDWELISRTTTNYKNLRVIRSPKNLFFGEGNNVLVDAAKGAFILFLNNDAYVGPDTIRSMLDHLLCNPSTAACGGTFLFPDLSIQEAGGVISDCGQQIQLHKHSSFEKQRSEAGHLEPTATEYVSSACFCVRKSALMDIGAYDMIFEPLYFEDSDLCKRLTSAGYRIDYLPTTYVIHVENATTKDYLGNRFYEQIEKNRIVFRDRWLYSRPGYRPRAIPAAVKAEQEPGRQSAVLYTPYDLGIGGGERYILSVAAALAETYNVTVATPTPSSQTRLAFTLQDLGIATTDEMILNITTFENVAARPTCDLMIAMGNQVIPPILLTGRKNIYHCQFPFPGHHDNRWQANRLDNLDALIVNSEFTKRHLQKELAHQNLDCPIHVTYAPVKQFSSSGAKAAGLRLVNVGRFDPAGHSKRQDFIVDVFVAASPLIPGISLSLVGGLPVDPRKEAYVAALRKRAGGYAVDFHLNAPRSVLEAELSRATVYFHACGVGQNMVASPERQEHFGISVVEGMMAGLIPVVYDGGGPAEITSAAGVGFRYRTFGEAVAILQTIAAMGPEEIADMSRRSIEFAHGLSDDHFRQRVRSIVADVMDAVHA